MRLDERLFWDMIGVTLTKVDGLGKGSGEVLFTAEDGTRFLFHHEQDCCESVVVDEVDGDEADLVGSPLTMAEAVSSADEPDEFAKYDQRFADDVCHESHTWTFYRFGTRKGMVVVRWLGQSNGYYSESVSYRKLKPGQRLIA